MDVLIEGEEIEGLGEPLLTVAQCASFLKVNPYTVRRWLRRGKLRGDKLPPPAGWRITPNEVRRFLNDASQVHAVRL